MLCLAWMVPEKSLYSDLVPLCATRLFPRWLEVFFTAGFQRFYRDCCAVSLYVYSAGGGSPSISGFATDLENLIIIFRAYFFCTSKHHGGCFLQCIFPTVGFILDGSSLCPHLPDVRSAVNFLSCAFRFTGWNGPSDLAPPVPTAFMLLLTGGISARAPPQHLPPAGSCFWAAAQISPAADFWGPSARRCASRQEPCRAVLLKQENRADPAQASLYVDRVPWSTPWGSSTPKESLWGHAQCPLLGMQVASAPRDSADQHLPQARGPLQVSGAPSGQPSGPWSWGFPRPLTPGFWPLSPLLREASGPMTLLELQCGDCPQPVSC